MKFAQLYRNGKFVESIETRGESHYYKHYTRDLSLTWEEKPLEVQMIESWREVFTLNSVFNCPNCHVLVIELYDCSTMDV